MMSSLSCRKLYSILAVSTLYFCEISLVTAWVTNGGYKEAFLTSLDHLDDRLNEATTKRTDLLNQLIANKIDSSVDPQQKSVVAGNKQSDDNGNSMSIQNPGKWESMLPVAPGTWQVTYAPHMTTMAKLFGGGEFRVQYILHEDGTMESHARLDFPFLLGLRALYLSVSGTYGSVSDDVCRVDFNEAWIKAIPMPSSEDGVVVDDTPFANLSDVPDSPLRSIITNVGRTFFIENFSIFPVSFLDDDLIVFDFELLGTRICARKVSSLPHINE
mmetsp:Transcript_5442/g.8281  ORF Transcript_5442/g.8281 Transcript_5442/m.8281 type:complete len:272 (-) Transcript_5442:18-833(-)